MINPNDVKKLYNGEQLSVRVIAKRLRCSQSAIYRVMKRHNMPRRTQSEAYALVADKIKMTRKPARGALCGNWKGGSYESKDGYVKIRIYPDSPFFIMTEHHGYVLEHRLVMAQHLGRPLKPDEVIHHKNGVRNDNRIDNLHLIPSRKEHNIILVKEALRLQLQINILNERVTLLEAENVILMEQLRELGGKEATYKT